jgi:preprotein translocase subunit SecE
MNLTKRNANFESGATTTLNVPEEQAQHCDCNQGKTTWPANPETVTITLLSLLVSRAFSMTECAY